MNVRNWSNLLYKLNKSDLTESTNCVLSWYGVGVTVTACIHGTELIVDVPAYYHGTELM
jgi:hypothetical protein